MMKYSYYKEGEKKFEDKLGSTKINLMPLRYGGL